MNNLAYSAKIVFVYNVIGKSEGKPAVQIAAEVERGSINELETFMIKCKSEKEAQKIMDQYSERVKKTGWFLLFVPSGIPSPKK